MRLRAKKEVTASCNYRIPVTLLKKVHQAAEIGGFETDAAFIRAALERTVRDVKPGDDKDERIAGTLKSFGKRLWEIEDNQKYIYAAITSLTMLMLKYFAEPVGQQLEANLLTRDDRYRQVEDDISRAVSEKEREAEAERDEPEHAAMAAA